MMATPRCFRVGKSCEISKRGTPNLFEALVYFEWIYKHEKTSLLDGDEWICHRQKLTLL